MSRREMSTKTTLLAGLWIGTLGAIAAARAFLPQLLRPDLYQGDLCQHVWWTYRFADPELFPHDPIAAFMSRPLFALYGWQELYRLLVPYVDAQRLAETIPFLLAVAVVALAWILGVRCAGRTLGGVVGAAYIILSGRLGDLEGGLPRSFALPILMLGVWALMERRHLLFGLSSLVAALFYPPCAANLGVFGAVVLITRVARERALPRHWAVMGLLGLAAVGVLLYAYAPAPPPEIGPRVTAAEARAMPQYWPGGRARFFEPDPIRYYFKSTRTGLEIRPLQAALWVAAILVAGWLWRQAVPMEAWVLLLTSLGCFVTAHLTLFALHYPNRYAKYALPVFFLMWLSAIVPRLLDAIMARWGRSVVLRPARRPLLVGVAALAVVAGSALTAGRSIASDLSRPEPAGLEEAYRFLRSMPKDTLVAAHPLDADGVGLRARRSFLASMETSLPYYREYYRRVSERIEAELAACFATRWEDVERLHDRYGADVFLVNRRRYEDGGWHYFAPFEEENRARFAKGREAGFVLLDPPRDRVLFSAGDYVVVRLGPLPASTDR